MHNFSITLAHTYDVGFDGFIARCCIFEAATQDVSGMHCPNYRRHSIKHMSERCERSIKQTRILPTDYFNSFLLLPARSELKNWQNSSHLISSQDRLRSSRKDGAWMILWMRCCLRVQHCLLLIVDGSQVIQFSHFSVKEFLTSG